MQISSSDYARSLDRADELAEFRSRFHLPSDRIYLDGNSLGLLSFAAESALHRVVEEWKALAVDGWLQGEPPWFTMAEEAAALMAPLVGAETDEVIVGSSTTISLHQLLSTLYHPAGARTRILIDDLAFPSDRYAVTSHLQLRGLSAAEHLRVVPTVDGIRLEEKQIVAAMKENVHLALLPSVVYTTGQLLDIFRLTRAAHERGILVGFDCSHSAGVIPHQLTKWGVDFAFWCGYKYLNGGPGAAAGLYLNRRHFGKGPGLAGWFSSDKQRQFDMAPTLTPACNACALQIGTPPILSIAPLLGSLPIVQEAGIERIRAKSLMLTDYLMRLVETELGSFGFRFATPREPERRGGHAALIHDRAAGICAALKVSGVVPDYRPPNIVRLAPAPLYNTFEECREAVRRLRAIMEEERWRHCPSERGLVA